MDAYNAKQFVQREAASRTQCHIKIHLPLLAIAFLSFQLPVQIHEGHHTCKYRQTLLNTYHTRQPTVSKQWFINHSPNWFDHIKPFTFTNHKINDLHFHRSFQWGHANGVRMQAECIQIQAYLWKILNPRNQMPIRLWQNWEFVFNAVTTLILNDSLSSFSLGKAPRDALTFWFLLCLRLY